MDLNDLLAMGALEDDGQDNVGALSDILNSIRGMAGGGGRKALPARAQAGAPLNLANAMRALGKGGSSYPAQTPVSNDLQNLLSLAAMNPGVRPGGPAARIETLGGSPSSFTFGPATAQVATITLTPYKAVKPMRLIISQNVVGAPGALAVMTNASVGDRNQLAGPGGVPIDGFAANATFSAINWDIIIPSVPLILQFASTATPAANTSITFSVICYAATLS